jgi:general stress protein YciG
MSDDEPATKGKRGFAAMSPEKRREIASMGGKAVPANKRSFSQNIDLAASAGRKGGNAVCKLGAKGRPSSRKTRRPDAP